MEDKDNSINMVDEKNIPTLTAIQVLLVRLVKMVGTIISWAWRNIVVPLYRRLVRAFRSEESDGKDSK